MSEGKIKIDYAADLPHRANYTNESRMPYAGRRIDKVITGGPLGGSSTGSGARLIMSSKFQQSALQPLNGTEREELSGVEEGYIRSDWGVYLSGSGDQIVLDVIKDNNSFDDYITIIHCEALNRNIISCSRIPKMMKHHAAYGFDVLLDDEVVPNISPGCVLRSNTKLTHTRAKLKGGGLGTGRIANNLFISSFSTNEDTCCVLDTVPRDFGSVGVEEFSIKVDNEHIPMYIHPHGIPRVGDILEDGKVMAIRRRERSMGLAQRTRRSMSKPRCPNDITYFAKRGAEVISVEIISASSPKIMNHYLPTDIVSYLDKASAAGLNRHHTILELDRKYKREHRKAYARDPSWNIMVTESIKHLYGNKLKAYYPNGYGKSKEVHRTIEDNIISGYLIRIKVRSIITPHLGHKFNDDFGAKYIISEIRSKERMFKDKWGRVAEFVTNGVANVNRGIFGRIHSMYRGDTRFHLLRTMREIHQTDGFEAAAKYYMGGIKVLSDKTFWKLSQLPEDVLNQHITYVLKSAPFIQNDDELGDESLTIHGGIKIRKSVYRPPMDKLMFTDYNGIERETVGPMRIGTLYISINDKIGSDCNACNIPMRQHSGISRKLGSIDKKTSQLSLQPSRAYSEADFRMILDSQSPEDARLILRDGTSMRALTETITAIVDGAMVPDLEIDSTDSRGMEILKAELMTDGVELTNIPRAQRWKRG